MEFRLDASDPLFDLSYEITREDSERFQQWRLTHSGFGVARRTAIVAERALSIILGAIATAVGTWMLTLTWSGVFADAVPFFIVATILAFLGRAWRAAAECNKGRLLDAARATAATPESVAYEGAARLRICAEGVVFTRADEEIWERWPRLRRIERTEDFILITRLDAAVLFIPCRAFVDSKHAEDFMLYSQAAIVQSPHSDACVIQRYVEAFGRRCPECRYPLEGVLTVRCPECSHPLDRHTMPAAWAFDAIPGE
jgi:hypothetical protein